MYEARQNKEKVSRRIDDTGGSKQRIKIITESKNTIQRKYQSKEKFSDGELYMVNRENLDTGTETTSKTREYVNCSSVKKPNLIYFDYEFDDSSAENAANKIKNNPLSLFWVNNPKPDKSYSSGKYWDAGHKLALLMVD